MKELPPDQQALLIRAQEECKEKLAHVERHLMPYAALKARFKPEAMTFQTWLRLIAWVKDTFKCKCAHIRRANYFTNLADAGTPNTREMKHREYVKEWRKRNKEHIQAYDHEARKRRTARERLERLRNHD